MTGAARAPVEAIRVGPGRFLLSRCRIGIGLVFATAAQTFQVVSEPVMVGAGTFLATVAQIAGPGAQRRLTVELQTASDLV